MRELITSRDIASSAEVVWEIITDWEEFDETISAIDEIERLDDGSGFTVGMTWRETRTLFGRSATEVMEVTHLEPGRSYVTTADSHGAHYRSEMTVESVGDNKCRLSMAFGAQPHGRFTKVMAATVGRLFERATRKAFDRDLADIAAAAESRRNG